MHSCHCTRGIGDILKMASLKNEPFLDIKSQFGLSNDNSDWIPLSLTHVEYLQGKFHLEQNETKFDRNFLNFS